MLRAASKPGGGLLQSLIKRRVVWSLIVAFIVWTLAAIIDIGTHTYLVYYYDIKGQELWQITLNVIDVTVVGVVISVCGSATFFVLILRKSDDEFQRGTFLFAKDVMLDTTNALHSEFVPKEHYGISNEGDPRFLSAIRADLSRTEIFYFSGISARIAVTRIEAFKAQSLRTVLLRLPISDLNLDRAVQIRRQISEIYDAQGAVVETSSELLGLEDQADSELQELGRSKKREDSKEYIKRVSKQAILYAFCLTAKSNVEVIVRDWREGTYFRTELFDDAIYLGNYQRHGEPSRFIPGTAKFAKTTFIYKILRLEVDEELRIARIELQSKDHKILLLNDKTRLQDVVSFVQKEIGLNCDGGEKEIEAEFSAYSNRVFSRVPEGGVGAVDKSSARATAKTQAQAGVSTDLSGLV